MAFQRTVRQRPRHENAIEWTSARRSTNHERRRSIHTYLPAARYINLNILVVLGGLQTESKLLHVQCERPGLLLDESGGQRRRIAHQGQPHVPELSLVTAATRRLGCAQRLCMEVERKVPADPLQFAGIDPFLFQLHERRLGEFTTEGTLQIRELDNGQRGVRSTEAVA
jgi:hypothetical protein